MDRLNSAQGNTRQRGASRLTISLFRGRSGGHSPLLSNPVFLSPPEAPRLLPQRPPRQPKRLPPLKKAQIKQGLSIVCGLAVVGLLIYFCSGQSEYSNHLQQARQALWRGDLNETLAQGNQMVELEPKNAAGYDFRAQAYYAQGNWRPAAANWRRVIALTPDSEWGYAGMWQNLGCAEDYYGDHAQAIRDFTESIRLDPSIPDTPGRTADVEDGTGDAHKNRMWAYYHSGQYALAMQDCNTLIAVHPYPTNIAVRGKLYLKMGDFDSAETNFRTALRENPHLIFASYLLSGLLGQKGQFLEALAVVQAEAAADPNNCSTWNNVGWWQYRAGQTTNAIVTFQKALKMGGRQPLALYNLGLAYAVEGSWQQAQPALSRAVQISSGDQRRAAEGDVWEALKVQPKSVVLRQALAFLHSAHTLKPLNPERQTPSDF
ncbi:MAG: tetratricopeptide repeat protein [Janthinobacterium lividum]